MGIKNISGRELSERSAAVLDELCQQYDNRFSLLIYGDDKGEKDKSRIRKTPKE